MWKSARNFFVQLTRETLFRMTANVAKNYSINHGKVSIINKIKDESYSPNWRWRWQNFIKAFLPQQPISVHLPLSLDFYGTAGFNDVPASLFQAITSRLWHVNTPRWTSWFHSAVSEEGYELCCVIFEAAKVNIPWCGVYRVAEQAIPRHRQSETKTNLNQFCSVTRFFSDKNDKSTYPTTPAQQGPVNGEKIDAVMSWQYASFGIKIWMINEPVWSPIRSCNGTPGKCLTLKFPLWWRRSRAIVAICSAWSGRGFGRPPTTMYASPIVSTCKNSEDFIKIK